MGIDCKDYIERRVSHLESAGENAFPAAKNKPAKLDRREGAPRGYNTEKDVIMGGDLPHISQSFKKSSQLLQDVPKDLKRKGDFEGEEGELGKKSKKIKK